LPAPDVPARVAGLAYNAFGRWDSPLAQRLPSDEHLAADLRLLATRTQRLRTYSAAEFPTLPAQADALGLHLTLGVWLDNQPQRDEREIAAAVRAAREHRSVQRVIAGNETQLHRSLAPQALQAVLERQTPITAMVCGNDYLAAGALSALDAAGVEVPSHMSVISFNDNDFAPYLHPPLTTVRLPIRGMGEAAARYLLDCLSGQRPVQPGPLPMELVVRHSTGPITAP
jgi:DNA-binding LacI/PurR family transcriptional regulator